VQNRALQFMLPTLVKLLRRVAATEEAAACALNVPIEAAACEAAEAAAAAAAAAGAAATAAPGKAGSDSRIDVEAAEHGGCKAPSSPAATTPPAAVAGKAGLAGSMTAGQRPSPYAANAWRLLERFSGLDTVTSIGKGIAIASRGLANLLRGRTKLSTSECGRGNGLQMCGGGCGAALWMARASA